MNFSYSKQTLLRPQNEKYLSINPGSISIPKGDKINSFAVCDDDDHLTIYDFNYHKKDEVSL